MRVEFLKRNTYQSLAAFDVLCVATIASIYTNLNISAWVGLGDKFNLNLFYILLPFLFLLLPKYKSSLRSGAFKLLIIFAAFNLIACFRFGFNVEIVRIGIATLSFLVGFSLIKSKGDNKVSEIFNVVGSLVIGLIILRFLVYPTLSLQLFQGSKAALFGYPFLTAGGSNIEVTYLVFLSVLCGNKKISGLILFLSILLSVMYLSRVGVILFVSVLGFKAYKQLSRARFVAVMAVFLISAPVSLAILSPKTFERFTNISQEIEYGELGVGRIGLYKGAEKILADNLLGYGVGNSIPIMSNSTGVVYKENNVHNIYLQVLLDFGIFSFAAFVCFSVWLVHRSTNKVRLNKYLVLSTLYLIVGLVQFTGLDALGWLCIGLAYPSIQSARNLQAA